MERIGLTNLNDLVLISEDTPQPSLPLRTKTTPEAANECTVTPIFDDLEGHLIEEIVKYPFVIGCMAWLTNIDVLLALAGRESVSIIVQKEDFLRPDVGGWSKQRLRGYYSRVPGINRIQADVLYNYASDPTTEAIRCMGVFAGRDSVPPRMHHKFLVFCDASGKKIEAGTPWEYSTFAPKAVWTGSFNATSNATRSIENAVLIDSTKVAEAYYDEWRKLLGLSEPLDWESPYVNPEYRIGT